MTQPLVDSVEDLAEVPISDSDSSDSYLGEWSVEDTAELCLGHQPIDVQADTKLAHQMLDAGGVPKNPSLAYRLWWVSDRWLGLASDHSAGCQCKPCHGANRVSLAFTVLKELL